MKLDQPPKYLRSFPAKGIKAENPVNRTGGDYGAGLIRGYAVITRGEALGHGLWIDNQFLSDVAEQINTSEGHKSRFTHPGLSGDGLAKFLGRTKNATIDGDTVRADLHLSKSSHRTPDGDLAGYLLDRAEEDPASFGASIVYEPDFDEEDAFVLTHGGTDSYVSPDPLNVGNLPHARLSGLRAVDTVDDPAANPNGFFHRQDVATEAEALVAYSLGLSSDKPTETQFGVDADRVQSFISRFLNRHGLAVVPKHTEASMPKDQTPEEVTPVAADPTPSESTPVEQSQTSGQQFLESFGDQGGIWFAQGKSFEQAQQLYLSAVQAEVEALKKSNSELQAQLTANRGEAAPVTFQAEQTPEQKAIEDLTFKVGSTGLAKFAAGIKRAK